MGMASGPVTTQPRYASATDSNPARQKLTSSNPLGALKQQIDRVIGEAGTVGASQTARALEAVADRAHLRDALATIVGDQHLLSAVASKSYLHPNGFEKIPLAYTRTPEYKLVLHVWCGGRDAHEPSDIHNHRWDFSSMVLLGGLQWEQYEISASLGHPMAEYRYQSPEGSGSYSLEHVGSSPLHCVLSAWFSERTTYTFSRDALHRADPGTSMSVSLVLQGSPQQSRTRVFRSSTSHSLECVSVRPIAKMRPPKLRHTLEAVIESLG